MEKKTGLGKGLSALFTEKKVDLNALDTKVETDLTKKFLEIEIENINLNPNQPREDFDEEKMTELADSIKEKGIIQPVTVKLSKENSSRYDLISGERRVKAAEIAGMKKIPAYIYGLENDSVENMLELALVENIQRENLNPMELAGSFQKLIDECGLTQEQVAEKVSKQRSTVGNYLRLLKLPDEIKASLRKNEISEAHARMILRLDEKDSQLSLWRKIISENISVRKLEDITKKSVKHRKRKTLSLNEYEDTYFSNIENKLTRFFGTKVTIKRKSKSAGEIIIEYYSDDDLERISEKSE